MDAMNSTGRLSGTEELPGFALSEAEQQAAARYAEQIELKDSVQVLQYGAGLQRRLADFTDTALDKVQAAGLGEVGAALTDMVRELRDFDHAAEARGFLGIFGKRKDKLSVMREKYEGTERRITEITHALERNRVQLMKDASVMEKMYELNRDYHRQLSQYILAGERYLERVTAGVRTEDETLAERFRQRLYDLETSRQIAVQSAVQLRMMRENNRTLADKIQAALVHTVPLWRNQMMIALGLSHGQEAARAQRRAEDAADLMCREANESLARVLEDME